MRKLFLSTIASMCLAGVPALAQHKGCSIMSITKLGLEHPLTKAGLQHVRVVRQLEVGAKPGDVVFQFQHGRLITNRHMMPVEDGQVPTGVNRQIGFKAGLRATRLDCQKKGNTQ